VEDLHGAVRIEGGRDAGDLPQVVIDEFTQAAVVIDSACAAAPADVQFEAGQANWR